MSIEMPEMPPDVASALNAGLLRFAVAASAPSQAAGSAFVVKPSISRGARTIARSIEGALAPGSTAGVGAPMVVLGLDELAAGTPLRQSKANLWVQLFPATEGGARAIAEVDQGAARLTSICEGPQVKALAKRIGDLANAPALSAARQELTLIRVPALHLTAIWLRSDDDNGADDVLIPNDGPIAPLVPGQRYPLAEFQRIVAAMAAERLSKTTVHMGG